jgi:hypothetical protein
MTEHERNLTDLAAMFAMAGLLTRKDADLNWLAGDAYDLAEQLMIVREERMNKNETDQGIAAIKPKRKYERKSAN